MPRVFLIDTDTASDDAVALIMALRAPDVRVAAVTVVAGNVSIDQACRNALYTVELCGSDAPVFCGAEKPLERALEDATWFHGHDGLGDHGYPEPRRALEQLAAADAIVETAKANPGLTLVTLGPLTNLALALEREPDLGKFIGRCIVMGGAPCCEGNVTPAAEFNIWCDPEAAQKVVRGKLPIELVGWHLCRGAAVVDANDIEHIRGLHTRLGDFAIECNSAAQEAYFRQTGEYGISLPDPVAMAIALDPRTCLHASSHYIEIETKSELTRGMTVVDRLNVAEDSRNREIWRAAVEQKAKARICWTLDIARWKANLIAALAER